MIVRDRLLKIQSEYPALSEHNIRFRVLPYDTVQSHKEILAEIKKLLKDCMDDFVSFSNFVEKPDGSLHVRCSTNWEKVDENSQNFIGISYISIKDNRFNKEMIGVNG